MMHESSVVANHHLKGASIFRLSLKLLVHNANLKFPIGRGSCGYCKKVCFCSPGHRVVRPYIPANGKPHIFSSASPVSGFLRLDEFRDEAMKTVAKLCTSKLESHTDSFSSKMVKENYAGRAEKLISSVCETFELAEQVSML